MLRVLRVLSERGVRCLLSVVVAVYLASPHLPGQVRYRTLDDHFAPPHFTSLEEWKVRADYLREHVLASAGLLPLPERTPLRPSIFDEVAHPDYRVSKVYFQSLPGFLVTGNLYRPIGEGPFPAILSPHGHWAYGRLENTPTNSGPGRAISLARQGFVVFTYDMIGFNDSQQLPHTFGGRREAQWGLSLGGLQLWNSIRALDFLETLPDVRRDAIGMTGESGGGTQTFLLSAVDRRVAVSVPVNMISLQMQGGCLCENLPGLRLDTTNVEIAATIAPRPLLMISATGDWTAHTMEVEYPAVREIYELYGVPGKINAVRFTAEHNYNRDSREAMYAWMARWLQNAPVETRRAEKPFTVDPLPALLVFHHRAMPPEAVTAHQLTENWIDAAKRQLSTAPATTLASALRHALGFGGEASTSDTTAGVRPAAISVDGHGGSSVSRTVLLASPDQAAAGALSARGFHVKPIPFTAFDRDAASKVKHFETYNRTAASQRVADIVAAVRNNPGAILVAGGDDALAGLLALAVVDVPLAILDVEQFDTSNDDSFLDHLYVPGLRRAGDLRTAAALARGRVVVHNAGERFDVGRVEVRQRKLTAQEIAGMARGR